MRICAGKGLKNFCIKLMWCETLKKYMTQQMIRYICIVIAKLHDNKGQSLLIEWKYNKVIWTFHIIIYHVKRSEYSVKNLVYLQHLQNWLYINNSYLQQFLSITLYLNNHIFLWPWQHFYSCVHMKSNTCPDFDNKNIWSKFWNTFFGKR